MHRSFEIGAEKSTLEHARGFRFVGLCLAVEGPTIVVAFQFNFTDEEGRGGDLHLTEVREGIVSSPGRRCLPLIHD